MSCTTVLVGKKASNDGSTMVARTDDGFFDVKNLTVITPDKQPRKYKNVISQLEIELPGYRKEDVKAELKDGYLTISAQKTENKDE